MFCHILIYLPVYLSVVFWYSLQGISTMSQELRAQSLKTAPPLTLEPTASPGHQLFFWLVINLRVPWLPPHIWYIAWIRVLRKIVYSLDNHFIIKDTSQEQQGGTDAHGKVCGKSWGISCVYQYGIFLNFSVLGFLWKPHYVCVIDQILAC